MNLPEAPLFHIVDRKQWQEAVARGVYAPASLPIEGFIHCSTAAQIVETANRWYRGQSGLVLLRIDPRRLSAELKHEPPINPADKRRAQRFPHIYGPLNLDAVACAIEFPCESDGTFRLPEALGTSG